MVHGEAVYSVGYYKLLNTAVETGAPQAVIGIAVEIVEISIHDNREKAVARLNHSVGAFAVNAQGMEGMILRYPGVVDDSVIIAKGRNKFIRHLLLVFFIYTHLVKGAISLDLIIDVFAAELHLTAEVTNKTGLIPALGVASVNAELIGSRSKACYLAGFVG
jgi:hypothetical protein